MKLLTIHVPSKIPVVDQVRDQVRSQSSIAHRDIVYHDVEDQVYVEVHLMILDALNDEVR